MILTVLFWVILVLSALGGGYYWRAQVWFPGVGVTLVLLALLGLKVFPPGL
jgi:hypothetical protein